MAWSFGDGFDCYAAPADMVAGYWDSGTITNFTFTTGRFTGSQALVEAASGSNIVKSSAQNDAAHHIVCAFRQTAAISGSTLGFYLQLIDGSTTQCSVVFRSDGAILLTSGIQTGTVLATYAGAFPVTNTWYAFEIEVVISNTAGWMKVRKNGNTTEDFTSALNLDTQLSANAYANKLQLGGNTLLSAQHIDDLFWRSDVSSVAWLGDIRCYTRMPASDQSVQFSRTPTGVLTQTVPPTASLSAGPFDVFTSFTAGYSGTVTGVGIAVNSVGTSTNMKCAIYADNGSGRPGVVLASATAILTPVTVGTNAFTFSGVAVVQGTRYWIGASTNGTTVWTQGNSSVLGASMTQAYASFPVNNPVVTNPQQVTQMSWTYTATPANWQAVSEAQQDATASYVYDSTPGHADFYGIASIASTPVSTFMVTTRGYMQKSDAGTRTAAVQLKSGASTVASPTLTLTPSGWLWSWRSDLTDPATGSAWTPVAVNGVQIGPSVVA